MLYDGSFEGLLCCVHAIFYQKLKPIKILSHDENLQFSLYNSIYIETNKEYFSKVYNSIKNKIDPSALVLIQKAFLTKSYREENFGNTEMIICKFLVKAYKTGGIIMNNPAIEEFYNINKLVLYLSREAHNFLGFTRFSQYRNILFAKINPENNIIPLIFPHFIERFPSNEIIIFDENREIAGFYSNNKFNIAPVSFTEIDNALALSETSEEAKFQKLWRIFFDTISIESRENYKCQRNNMPKKYWCNLSEFQ